MRNLAILSLYVVSTGRGLVGGAEVPSEAGLVGAGLAVGLVGAEVPPDLLDVKQDTTHQGDKLQAIMERLHSIGKQIERLAKCPDHGLLNGQPLGGRETGGLVGDSMSGDHEQFMNDGTTRTTVGTPCIDC